MASDARASEFDVRVFRALRRTEEPQTNTARPMASFKLHGGCCTELLLATGVCDPSPRRAGGARHKPTTRLRPLLHAA